MDRTGKLWYLILRNFWLLLPKFNFVTWDWALGYVSTQIWNFSSNYLFSTILCLKSFDYSSGNSYPKFIILDIKFCFTFGASYLYRKIVMFQNIVNRIVDYEAGLAKGATWKIESFNGINGSYSYGKVLAKLIRTRELR